MCDRLCVPECRRETTCTGRPRLVRAVFYIYLSILHWVIIGTNLSKKNRDVRGVSFLSPSYFKVLLLGSLLVARGRHEPRPGPRSRRSERDAPLGSHVSRETRDKREQRERYHSKLRRRTCTTRSPASSHLSGDSVGDSKILWGWRPGYGPRCTLGARVGAMGGRRATDAAT